MKPNIQELCELLGSLVTDKQRQYGDSVAKTTEQLRILWPAGIQVHHYGDMQLVVRILDKLCRVAARGPEGTDLGGESPYLDLAGYGILGVRKDAK